MHQERSHLFRILVAAAVVLGPVAALAPVRLAAAAVVPAAVSVKASAPVRLDGKADEWTSAALFNDPKTGAELAFQNDGQFLYILMAFTKPGSAEAAEASGVTVLGAPGDKPKDAKGALFLRREVSAEAYIGWRERQGDVLTDKDTAEIRRMPRHPVVLAYATDALGRAHGPLVAEPGTPTPEFGVLLENGTAVFEFRIPLDPSAAIPGGIRSAPGTTVRLALTWGGPGRKSLSPHTGRESPTLRSGDLSGAGLTWAQEFIDTFDSMSRPTIGAKRFTVTMDVKLAGRD